MGGIMGGAIIVAVIAIVVGLGALFYTKQHDSPIEQASESIAEYELRLPPGSLDLSPD